MSGAIGWREERATKISPAIRRVIAFIEENCTESMTVSQLALLCDLSLHRFVTVFRCQVGLPPHQFLCRARAEHARRLLSEGLPLAEVALEAGFCDQSHLSRHFKRVYGITPGRFALSHSAKPLSGQKRTSHELRV